MTKGYDVKATAGVSELKASLSSYLQRVKAGEEVIVTERGKPIARVVPYGNARIPEDLEDLYRSGAIRPPVRPGPLPDSFWENMIEDPEGLFLKALLAEREEAPY